MIYTVGKYDIYEKALDEHPDLKKEIGGSVWRTEIEAVRYLYKWSLADTYAEEFEVYGIDADWEKDTVKSSPDNSWNDLIIQAKIIRLLHRG